MFCPQAQGFYDISQAAILNWQRFSENICVKVEQRRSNISSNTKTISIFFSSLPPPFSHTSPKILHISPFHFDLEIQHLPTFNSYYRRIQLSLNLYIAIHWGHICCTSTVNLGQRGGVLLSYAYLLPTFFFF